MTEHFIIKKRATGRNPRRAQPKERFAVYGEWKQKRRLLYCFVLSAALCFSTVGCVGNAGQSSQPVSGSGYGETPSVPPVVTTAVTESSAPPEEDPSRIHMNGGTRNEKDGSFSVSAGEEDQPVISVGNRGYLTLTNTQISSGSEAADEETSRTKGVNAAVLCSNSGSAVVQGGIIATTGAGGHGVFSWGTNSMATLTQTSIETSGLAAHGVSCAQRGKVTVNSSKITVTGDYSHAAAADQAGGDLNLVGSVLNASGQYGAALYSAGRANAAGCTLNAAAETVVGEGKTTVSLTGSAISGTGSHTVLLYHSGDPAVQTGTTSFAMTSGTLNSGTDGAIYVTNTKADVSLKNVTMPVAALDLLQVEENADYGQAGPADVKLTVSMSEVYGTVRCGADSKVRMKVDLASAFTGAVNPDGAAGDVHMVLDATASWTLTSDSYVTSFQDTMLQLTNIRDGGYSIYYDPSAPENAWLDGGALELPEGGFIAPNPAVQAG